MSQHTYTFTGTLQKFQDGGSWQFILVPPKLARKLRERYRPNHGGWSSLKVRATVGKTSWLTSIFWMKDGGYYLFLKASVRKVEHLRIHHMVRASVHLLNV